MMNKDELKIQIIQWLMELDDVKMLEFLLRIVRAMVRRQDSDRK